MNQHINLERLAVQTVANSSGIYYGRNLQIGVKSISKINQGCGTLGGDCNVLSTSINTVVDDDLQDSYVPVTKNGQA
jgi:hypothetical protein